MNLVHFNDNSEISVFDHLKILLSAASDLSIFFPTKCSNFESR